MQPQRVFHALTLLVHAAHRRVTTAAVGMDARPVRSPVRASRSSTRACPVDLLGGRTVPDGGPTAHDAPPCPRGAERRAWGSRHGALSAPMCAEGSHNLSADADGWAYSRGASGEPIPNRDTPVQAFHRGPEQLPADFDIRAWRAKHGLPARIDNPAVIEAVAALLARDLTPRLAASEERSRPSQGRTGRRSACRTGPADADSA
jgi:hypothetical protein